MTAIVLVAVMVDRSALTLRNLALAALGVMLLAPEAVVHPSFQMSFAATLALIAAYERGLPWTTAGADTSLGARVALWGGREIVALILASLVAGLATTPYAAFHFHRLAPYGVLANLLAMPIVSVWVMPAGLLALLALPFGFDAPLWRLMGLGIDWMIAVALFVASLPGAVGRMTAFGTGPLLLCTVGLVLLGLLRSPLRWSGAVTVIVAAALGGARAAAGRLSWPIAATWWRCAAPPASYRSCARAATHSRCANGSVPTPSARTEGRVAADGVACDEIGCVARLADGAIVALPFAAEAFEEDCRRAALVVSQRTAPPSCAATTIDRTAVAHAPARRAAPVATGWELHGCRLSGGYDRPWARARDHAAESGTSGLTARGQHRATQRRAPRTWRRKIRCS